MAEYDDRGIDAVVAALDALRTKPRAEKKTIAHEEEETENATEIRGTNGEAKHIHTFKTGKDGIPFCADCESIIVKAGSPSQLIDGLDNIYHPKTHNMLTCKTCRNDFVEKMKTLSPDTEMKKDYIKIPIPSKEDEE